MTTVTLIYPYFRPSHDNSIFRFPPLGLGYIASYLRQNKIDVKLVDCTFLSQEEAIGQVQDSKPTIIGMYSMFSMKDQTLRMAKILRDNCEMLVAGGPLPTVSPQDFLDSFDAVAIGEGEETMLDLVRVVESKRDLSKVEGIIFKERSSGSRIACTKPRRFLSNLDEIPLPARDLFDNEKYKSNSFKKFGYAITSIMTSRGCPFNCDFCSRPIFGNQFRTRSPTNILTEIEDVLSFGYDRIWFADDCFTLNRQRLINICDEIIKRDLKISWECLSRVDTIDDEVAVKMKQAGCVRVFFGLESGNDSILALMNKQATTKQAMEAVHKAKSVGIKVGAFFIVGYPGETDETVLETLRFGTSLPLDYLSFTLPYPIPGTPLYERVKMSLKEDDMKESKRSLVEHKLLYRGAFTEGKLKFAIIKATVQFKLKKYLGARLYRFLGEPFEVLTDWLFKLAR